MSDFFTPAKIKEIRANVAKGQEERQQRQAAAAEDKQQKAATRFETGVREEFFRANPQASEADWKRLGPDLIDKAMLARTNTGRVRSTGVQFMSGRKPRL